MDKLDVPFEVKAGEGGVIEGYGAVFGNIDQGGDVIEPGAFARTLSQGLPKMLWQHDPRHPIGVWTDAREDRKGLHLKGKLAINTGKGRDAYELLKEGAIDGLSIGYVTVDAEMDGNVRRLKEVRLLEVSLVTFPMNEQAQVDAVKASAMTEREFGRMLLRDSQLSRRVVEALLRDGWKGVAALRESSADLDGVTAALRRWSEAKQSMLETLR